MAVMSQREQKMVEDHIELVKSIVKSTISINENIQGLGYEDLFQVGCEALCHAAMRYNESLGASFCTFADRVVKNGLISHCRKVAKVQVPLYYLEMPLSEGGNLTLGETLSDNSEQLISDRETMCFLNEMESHFTGIARKGVEALRLKYLGHTGKEIADYYGVKTNNVTSWISRALQKIRAEQLMQVRNKAA